MIPGLYSAATGMMAEESRQAVIANNVANAATPGYKRQAPVTLGFKMVFSKAMRSPFYWEAQTAPGGGVKMVETYPNLGTGPLSETGNPLNVALSGPGFISVQTPRGERFTRSGDFTIDADGQLATAEGYKVQSVEGTPIGVRGARVTIGTDGVVTVDGAPAGTIRLMEFEKPERLVREGNNLYLASPEVLARSARAVDTETRQSYLEMSNVNLPSEMIQMIAGSRIYEANQRVIQAFDTTIGQLIEQVAAA